MRGVKWICSHDSWRLRRWDRELPRHDSGDALRGAIDMVTLSRELLDTVGNCWRHDSGDAEGCCGDKGDIVLRAPHQWQQLMP